MHSRCKQNVICFGLKQSKRALLHLSFWCVHEKSWCRDLDFLRVHQNFAWQRTIVEKKSCTSSQVFLTFLL